MPRRCRATAGASTHAARRPGCTATSSIRTASRSRPAEDTIYHSDTRSHAVVVHTLRDGSATDRRVIDTREYGQPDGLAVDEDGAIWIALLDYGIGRFTPDGRLDRRIEVPSSMTTSVCLHGRDLYVATADNTDDPERRGCLLHAEVDVAGTPVHPARV